MPYTLTIWRMLPVDDEGGSGPKRTMKVKDGILKFHNVERANAIASANRSAITSCDVEYAEHLEGPFEDEQKR